MTSSSKCTARGKLYTLDSFSKIRTDKLFIANKLANVPPVGPSPTITTSKSIFTLLHTLLVLNILIKPRTVNNHW